MNADERADKVARAMLAAEGTGPAWGIEIEEAREGYARIRMTLRADMLNGHGIAHGGMVFALADTAFAYACNSRNLRTVAAQASIVLLDAAKHGEILIAEAQETALVAAGAQRAEQSLLLVEADRRDRDTGALGEPANGDETIFRHAPSILFFLTSS